MLVFRLKTSIFVWFSDNLGGCNPYEGSHPFSAAFVGEPFIFTYTFFLLI